MLSRKLARGALRITLDSLPREVIEKVKLTFMDMLSCQFDSYELTHCGQTMQAIRGTDSPEQAAFVYAVLAHSLVREDMHTASVSHLGVVIYPTLMAFADSREVSGADFVAGATCGYEAGAVLGRHLMPGGTAKIHRPTGITGPIAATAAACRLLSLDESAFVSALGVATNTVSGLNEWAVKGSDDMYLHAGFAARNAITAVHLAESGIVASETILEGPAGLFAALGHFKESEHVEFFVDNNFEILSVFFKPAPACNYAQTPCQAALELIRNNDIKVSDIAAITVRCSLAAVEYPGCKSNGPFERELQARMSIPYNVAATLFSGAIEEQNYRLLTHPEITRLASLVKLSEHSEFTLAYPDKQGTEVIVTLNNGRLLSSRLEDLIPASEQLVRQRFTRAAETRLDVEAVQQLGSLIDDLENLPDMRELLGAVKRGLSPYFLQ